MAQVIRETRIVDTNDDRPSVTERSPLGVVAQVIYLISGIIIALLGMRMILSLLGANQENAFASFIYGVTQPMVAPFFGLFNYQMQYGVSRFEFETLIAIVVYAFVAWLIVRLLSLGREDETRT